MKRDLTMDALKLLKADHVAVEEKFQKFEALGNRAAKSKSSLVKDVVKALSIHASIEEQLFYPAIRERLEDSNESVLEALEEHHIMKWTLSELADMEPDEERFTAKFTVLIDLVRRHVKEEEKVLFPAVRGEFSKTELLDLGYALVQAKQSAPTRPHPGSPDEPPLNVVATLLTKPLDAVREVSDSVRRKVRA
jgi:hemerythrin-like domain-containing protein